MEKEKDEINNVFDSEVFAVENQAIKRGLARSSIVLMQLSRVESERAENLTETMRKLESSINSIESKIETKTRELDLAIEALDIEKIDKIEKEGKLKAIVSITLDNEFVVHDIKVIEGKDGYFISMPSKKKPDGEYTDIVHPIKTETRELLIKAILIAFEEEKAKPAE